MGTIIIIQILTLVDLTLTRYNPVPYHSRPLATNLLSNFLLDVRGGSGMFENQNSDKTKTVMTKNQRPKMLLTAIKTKIAGDIVMTSRPLVFTTELTTAGIQESDINVPAMQYMVYFILSGEVHVKST